MPNPSNNVKNKIYKVDNQLTLRLSPFANSVRADPPLGLLKDKTKTIFFLYHLYVYCKCKTKIKRRFMNKTKSAN